MKAKRFIAVLIIAVLALAAFAGCAQGAKNNTFVVGICQLAEHPALDAATAGFKRALTEKLGDKVTFKVGNAQGELTNCTTIVNGFVSAKVDLIMANATPAVLAAREATDNIPIVGTSVTDYVESGIVASDEKPGGNVTGASDLNPVDVQVELMKALCPNVKTVGIVYCSGEANSKIQADEAKAKFEAAGFTVKIYTVADSNDIQAVVNKACGEVDGFYEPTDNLIASNVPAMANITNAAGKPVIAAEESMCNSGFLATYSISYDKLGYEAGLMAADILANGKNPANMPIFHFDVEDLSLVINENTAKELGITIPENLK